MKIDDDKIFNTRVVNLEDLCRYKFTIPTYQRPYVWGDEHLKKLLDDFYKSFKSVSESKYYISTFLTKEEGNNAELIDGQQRFTSLWLISFVISKACPDSDINNFLKNNKELRLGFEIREEVSEFLNNLLDEGKTSNKIYDESFIENYPYLKNIAKGLVFINGYMEQLPKDEIKLFGNYIYKNVLLIKNTTPLNTDLNKLFSTINSAGVQLEQTDIVKANLLKQIDNKILYGKIWETCENMNNFFERNARSSFSTTDWNKVDLRKLVCFDENIFRYETSTCDEKTSTNEFTIDSIDIEDVKSYEFPPKNNYINEDRQSEEIYCRSIITFGQLLLHTYRIHLKIEGKEDFEGTFHVNRLISIFENLYKSDNEEIKRFLHLLWKVRYLFDKYIIKWISDIETKTESLELVNMNKNDKNYYSRSKFEKSDNLMLQSVLYFTGDYLRQYWLSSYLDYILYNNDNKEPTDIKHLEYLEKIDNVFSLNRSITDKELSRKMMFQTSGFSNNFNIREYLSSSIGTSFKHYWFQKLEYILWKNWKKRDDIKFKQYRITSKNSVEHVFPQNEEFSRTIDENILNSYGNLALLSVSQNSEYSNQDVKKKKIDFDNKPIYDSLKLSKIYSILENNSWDEGMISEHQEKMICLIEKHYKNETNHAVKD